MPKIRLLSASCSDSFCIQLEEGACEILRNERAQIVDSLADATGFVRTDPKLAWPADLQTRLPQ